MMTPEEARKAWVEALRSGEYKQGKGFLTIDGKYCCLGVACELAVADGVPVTVQKGFTTVYDGTSVLLPESVQKWLGLSVDNGSYVAGNHRQTDLAKRNDDGVKFARIADIIESEPKGLLA